MVPMKRFAGFVPVVLAGVFAAAFAAAFAVAAADEPEVTFVNATECRGEHAVYRIDVKNDLEAPPDTIAPENRIKPSVIAAWPAPRGVITKHTPRSGKEKQWFAVTGRVTLVKAEEDGDLHIQLVDEDGGNKVNVVVEVPVKQLIGDSPWDKIREEVFGWTKVKFPFKTRSSLKLTPKGPYPVVTVEGKAFFDATHAGRDKDGNLTNRREDAGAGEEVTVWEIHPVMMLTVLKEK
jgi:hypothetical protein